MHDKGRLLLYRGLKYAVAYFLLVTHKTAKFLFPSNLSYCRTGIASICHENSRFPCDAMILSYETVKYASIQDSRLGLLRYTLVGAILIYVVVFELWAFGGYLASVPIHGAFRGSLQQPTEGDCDPFNDPDCRNRFTPVNELFHCQQSLNSSAAGPAYPGNVYPCRIYEAINAQVITETSITVLTRAKTIHQTLVCGDHLDVHGVTTCPHTYETTIEPLSSDASIEPFYIAESEAFTLLFDHAVTAAGMCPMEDSSRGGGYACSAPSSNFHGRLFSNNPHLCQEHDTYHQSSFQSRTGHQRIDTAPCYIEPNQTMAHLDYFSLDVLLRASGIASLDECVDSTIENVTGVNNRTTCQTYRETGATLLLTIEWSDFISYHGMVEPFYSYRVQIVSRSYKTSIPYYESYRQNRTLLTAHGVRIAVSVAGEFHHFEWMSFLITITTALGLLAVATTVVDSCMLYVLPEKEKYTKAKYEATSDLIVEIPNPTMIPSLISGGLGSIRRPRQANSESENIQSMDLAATPNDTAFTSSDPLLLSGELAS
jgi:ATP P2X receptor